MFDTNLKHYYFCAPSIQWDYSLGIEIPGKSIIVKLTHLLAQK